MHTGEGKGKQAKLLYGKRKIGLSELTQVKLS